MDPIELQIQQGLAQIQAQPGFENYQPSFENQSLTPMGLTEPQGTQLPDFKEMAKNIAMNTAKNYAIKKIGLEGIKGNVLNSVIGASSFTNPIGALYTVGSLLPDGVKGIAGVLRQKRANKSMQKAIKQNNEKDSQGGNNTVNMAAYGIPTAGQPGFNIHNDKYDRGGGGGGRDHDGGASAGAQGDAAAGMGGY